MPNDTPDKTIDPPQIPVGRSGSKYSTEVVPKSSYPSYGYDYNPDTVLSNKGKSIDMYKNMRLDETVNAATLIHKEISLAGDWSIEPEDESAEAIYQAEFVKDCLDNLETIPFVDVMDGLLDMRWLGYVIAEPRWKADGNSWRIADIKLKDSSLFQFKTDPYGNLEKVHMLAANIPDIDPKHLVIGVYPYVSNGNWYGQSCFQSIYSAWWTKTNILKFRNTYLQSRGGAPLQGIYNANSPTAKRTVETLMDALQNDFWASVPGHMENGQLVSDIAVQVIRTASETGTSEFEKAIVQLDTAITRGLLLPDNLGFTTTSAGSYAQSKVQMQQVMYGIKKSNERLCDIVNDQIISRLLAVNFDRPTRARLKFETPDDGTTETKAKIVEILVRSKVIKPEEEFVRPYLGIPCKTEEDMEDEMEDEEEMVPPVPDPTQPTDEDPEDSTDVPEDTEDPVIEQKVCAPNKKVKMKLGPEGRYIRPFKLRETTEIFDKAEGEALTRIADIFTVCTPDLIAMSQKAINSGKLGEVNNVSMRSKYTGAVKDAILRSMYKVYLEGKIGIAKDLREYTGKNASQFRDAERRKILRNCDQSEYKYGLKLKELKDFTEMGYAGISKWLSEFGATLTKADKLALRDMAEKAYAIAGQDISATLSDKIRQTLRNGWGKKTSAQLIAEVTDVVNNFISVTATDEAVASSRIADAVSGLDSYGRIKTIVRNNLTTEYNQGLMNQVLDPELQGFVEAMQYVAIIDDMTTDFCSSHDGEIVEVGSPEYLLLNPPNHHNCRATWMAVFRGEKYKKDWGTKTDSQLERNNISRDVYSNGYKGFGKV